MGPTVVVVDSRCIFSECLCEFLAHNLKDLRILSVSNTQQASELAFLPVTCVLLSNREDVPAIREVFPSASLLLICDGHGSAMPDPQVPRLMLDMPRNVFAEIVRCAARDGCIDALNAAPAPSYTQLSPEPPEVIMDMGGQLKLSDRESEVLAALKRGLPNKMIAHEMDLSENTVKIHVRNIMRKLGVTNRTMAALYDGAEVPEATHPA